MELTRLKSFHLGAMAAIAICLCASPAGAAEPSGKDGVEFFEKKIRPVLEDSCYRCHSAKARKVKGKLMLDTWEGISKGGESGKPAFARGDPDKSLGIVAIRYTDKDGAEHDALLMPPPKDDHPRKLPDAVIKDFEEWVRIGAPYPKPSSVEPKAATPADPKRHWAFIKPTEPPLPAVKNEAAVSNGVDRLILARLEVKGLSPNPRADKRTLIRRASFDLTGLPPTPQEVADFEADRSPDAFAKVIDRLLASPRYGERWGRYWLDVARYSDTKGYVFEEERRYPYAYTYRDWVIRSFNEDLPYDQFLIQQIAADRLELRNDKRPLAAMGFLTLGRRFLNNQPDIIDDRIDVVCRGTMALTVGCARCHDHKFDPIPTADYYSLYAVFANCPDSKNPPLIGMPDDSPEARAFEAELAKQQGEVDRFLRAKFDEIAPTLRSPKSIADALMAAQFKDQPDDRIYMDGLDVNPFILGRWKAYLADAANHQEPIFAPWRAYAALRPAEFAARSAEVTDHTIAHLDPRHPVHPLVAAEFAGKPPASMRDAATRYGALIARYDKPDALPDPNEESLRKVIRGPGAPANIGITDVVHVVKRDARDRLTQLQKKVDAFKASNRAAPPRAMTLEDNVPKPQPHPIFRRGNPGNIGETVPPRFLAILSGSDRPTFQNGSGRLDLAQAIASRENPLTARVLVNRVWLHHFGAGLVRTPSDFGTRSDPPANPQLLDWLAVRFMQDGWSVKKLQRLIMLSSTYQQTSDDNPAARKVDPENTLQWRMNRQRLDFEATRDSLLAASGQIDLTLGGRAVDITVEPYSGRRSVYAFIDRQNLPGLFRSFDFASPDATSPQRFTTTVPQQSLFMMNSPFVVQQAQRLAARPEVVAANGVPARITSLYRLLFARDPFPDELGVGAQFVAGEGGTSTASVWQYGYGGYDESAHRVASFKPLPFFSGSAWHGGPHVPDAKLGWVVLGAGGGHPGNDAQHAVIRRWTAPIDGAVRIAGTLDHPSANGDGVRGRIISSRLGELASWNVHHSQAETVIENVEVKKGDTIDFVLDCRSDANYDSFMWSPLIRSLIANPVAGSASPEEWNAAAGFAGPKSGNHALGAWEKYSQILLESNEFVFVD